MSKTIYLFSTSSHPDVISINSLDITFFQPEIDFSNYDYLIFTSKQAVNALNQAKKYDYKNTPALCISQKTAEALQMSAGTLLEIGTGYGDNLSSLIQQYDKEKKWLYLRAKEVISSFAQDCAQEGYNIDEVIIYESGCSQEILDSKIEENAIYIFTSPSSVKCFLKTHVLTEKSDIIVIGNSTAKVIPKGIKCKISKKRTVQSCIELSQGI